jgi:hypothetical protein
MRQQRAIQLGEHFGRKSDMDQIMMRWKLLFQSLVLARRLRYHHAIVVLEQSYLTGADSDLKLYIIVKLRNSRKNVTINSV